MTRTQLLHLTQEMEVGRPLWSLLRANEWMSESHPIRRGIARQAGALLEGKLPKAILEALRAGASLSSFDVKTQTMLKTYNERPLRALKQLCLAKSFARTLTRRGDERRVYSVRTNGKRRVVATSQMVSPRTERQAP